ncbi:MAG: hypothetical protein Ct9H300mP9_5000 [Candidatus Neomarinimicrobiota bacterium]|nr:MAG: hypothetical protein Ct9H300mP9_5000 [Candidatus Neomarinimicrobiota bacterium]
MGYLIKQAKDAMRYETDIFYTGNLEKDEVGSIYWAES